MATETLHRRGSAEVPGDDVRTGPPLDVPAGPMARWYIDVVERHGSLPAAHVRDGDRFTTNSYDETFEEACAVAGGLLELAEPGDRVAIRAETRYEWTVVDLACTLAGLVLVPVYPQFSPEQTAFVIEDAGTRVAVTESELPLEAEAVLEDVLDIEALPRAAFDPEEALGLEADDGDVHTLVYTSGTTGMPKGCEITHRNVLAQLAMAEAALPSLPPGSVGTAFLPLNHVYQRVATYSGMNQGFSAAYMTPADLVEELGMVRPNVVPSVPRLYRRMYDGLVDAVREESAPKRRIAEWAIDVAVEYGRALEGGAESIPATLRAKHALADRLVLSTFRERLGLTEVAYAITGAASIDPEVLYFFWGMGVPLLEGYGATETTAGLTINRMDDFHPGTVGTPMPGMAVRLDTGTETPDGGRVTGEVLAHGPGIMRGYWNDPEATDAAIDADGWYRTGDIGEWQGEYLRIVDRKKRLQVLDTGKNVYPAPIEDALRRSPDVAEALVVAEGRKYVAALLQPNLGAALETAREAGAEVEEAAVEYDERGEVIAVPRPVVEHPAVRERLEAAVEAANESLADYERVKRFGVIERALSVGGGELTPTLKKRRGTIEERYADRIEALYD
jgi:long-chain acyl-CoA synthetase